MRRRPYPTYLLPPQPDLRGTHRRAKRARLIVALATDLVLLAVCYILVRVAVELVIRLTITGA